MDQNKIKELLHLSVHGNKEAFREIVDAHSNFVYSVTLKMVANEEDAKDIVQEVFIKVWKNLHRFDPKMRFTTWLYKIVTNRCLDYLKSKHRSKAHAYLDVETIMNTIKGSEPEKSFILKDLIGLIKGLSQNLTPVQRVVFVLYFLEEKDIDEIGWITGYKKGNIKSNIYYARKNMLELIEKTTGINKLSI